MEERSSWTGLPLKATQSSTWTMYRSEIIMCLQSKTGIPLGVHVLQILLPK